MSRRRTALAAALTIVVVVAVAVVWRVGSQNDDVLVPLATYPRQAVVCESKLSKGCTTEAARRVSHEIAWLSPRGDLKFVSLVAIRSTAIQELNSRVVVVSVSSGQEAPPEGEVIGRIQHGADAAVVRRTDLGGSDGLSVDWARGATRFRIDVVPTAAEELGLDLAKDLFARIEYSAGQE